MVETFATNKETVHPATTEMEVRVRPESPLPGRLAVGRATLSSSGPPACIAARAFGSSGSARRGVTHL
jgi:hypothetical protein